MNYQSRRVTIGAAWAATGVTSWGTRPAGALILTPKARLTTFNGFNPQPGDTIAGAAYAPAEADFVGYTAGGYAVTLSGQVNLGSGLIGQTANVIPICSGAGAPSPNTCYGWWIDDGTNIIVAEAFAGGFAAIFAHPGDYLDLQIAIPFALFANTQ